MKKTIAVASLIVIAAVWTAIFFLRPGKSYFPPRPEDTSLEFWICDDMAEADWSDYDGIPGWGSWEFLGKNYHIEASGERPQVRVSYILTAWPDYADGGIYITGIEITDPSVSVYGLTTESQSSEFEQIMRSMGYRVETVNSTLMKAVRDGFTFSLYSGEVPELKISAEVSNREGIDF